MARRSPSAPQHCPCGTGLPLEQCCGVHLHGTPAPDAQALMRSRYTAFVLGDTEYLLSTWHPDSRPQELELQTPSPKWLGLKLLQHECTGDHTATVEFVARYKIGGKAHRLHEISRFVLERGRWFYVTGEFPAA